MEKRILDAYYEYRLAQVRAGIIDDSLTDDIDDKRSMDERIIEVLRAAGRLPEGWNHDQVWRPIDPPRELTDGLIRRPLIINGHARLIRAYLPYAS